MSNKSRLKFSSVKIGLFLSLLGLSITPPVFAELDLTGIYYGIQFADSRDQFEDSSGKTTENRGHIKLKVGKILNEHVSLEGQLGGTTNTSTSQGILTYGGYARVDKDFDGYKLYGLLGFGGIHAFQDNVGDVTESSFSYGAGLEIFGSKHIAITLELVSILDKSVNGGDSTFSTIGAGFTYYFIEDKSYFNRNRNKIRSIRY